MRRNVVSKETLVPLGVLIAAVTIAVGWTKATDSTATDVATLKVRVGHVESEQEDYAKRVTEENKWRLKVSEDLGKIKGALGVKD